MNILRISCNARSIGILFVITAILLSGCKDSGGKKKPRAEETAALVVGIASPTSDTTIIAGQSLNLQGYATGGKAPLSYLWTIEGGSITTSSEQNPGNVKFDTPGTFNLSLKVTDMGNQTSGASVAITIKPQTPPPPADTTPPAVKGIAPANNAVNVPKGTTVSVTFSESVDPATITASTLVLSLGYQSIPGTVALSGLTATFTPSSPLNPWTTYTATATKGIKDLSGNPLAADYSWSFTTVHDSSAQYSVINLGTIMGGNWSAAYDINNNGQVVGSSANIIGYEHGFLYSNGVMTDLGILEGGFVSSAWAINNNGDIVGWSSISSLYFHAYLYSNGSMEDLNIHPTGGNSAAYDINNNGQVVGYEIIAGQDHGFIYGNGVVTDIGTFQKNYSYALRINDSGQVIGHAGYNDKNFSAFIYNYSDGTFTDLGTLGGTWSWAGGINDTGQVVGSSGTASGSYHAFLYGTDGMMDLGTLPGGCCSEAKDINNAGQVVGFAYNSENKQVAFLYSGGEMKDLNTLIDPDSSWVLTVAWAINDNGQIVGEGTLGGVKRAFLLNPLR